MTEPIYRLRIGFQDTDSTSRVYFVNYAKWFDIAFIEFLRNKGIVFDRHGRLIVNGNQVNATFVIGEYGVRIERPSGYDDEVSVHIMSIKIRPKVVKTDFMLKDGPGEVLARGYITYVYVDLETSRSTEIPKNIQEVFRQFEGQNVK